MLQRTKSANDLILDGRRQHSLRENYTKHNTAWPRWSWYC